MDGKEVELKNKEYELLLFLMSNADIVFSRETLYERIWGCDALGDNATVAVHINRLREKIEKDPSAPRHIQTVWGAGYRFPAIKKAAAPAQRSRPRKSGASPGSAFFSCCCVILRGDAAGALRQKRALLAQNAQKLSIPFYRSEIPVKKAKQISKIQIYSVCSQMV